MSKMSHVNVIEKYEEHRKAIHHLLASILGCFANEKMLEQSSQELSELLKSLCNYYSFVSLLYLLDSKGKQMSPNISGPRFKNITSLGEGLDRSKRPYFLSALKSELPIVTEPYLSSVERELCLSACTAVYNDGNIKGYIVLDIDLSLTLSFFTGENRRVYFEPYFKAMYSIIVIGLFIVSLILIYASGFEGLKVFQSIHKNNEINIPFGMVIYLTLALAIFDLGKTILEEEVLLYKDILRHSSTRRTITRFIAAIIIAVSIEALLLVFKAALDGNSENIVAAVWVILAAAVLLLCLGFYIYLSSKAETLLLKNRERIKKERWR